MIGETHYSEGIFAKMSMAVSTAIFVSFQNELITASQQNLILVAEAVDFSIFSAQVLD
jgi:hypothetical protein